MNFDEDLLEQLSTRLRGEIPGWTPPGWDAQQRMATEVHRHARLRPRTDARRAAVLMLLYPHNGLIYLPLIVRPTYAGVHSGQIALPGGKVEPQDASLVATALRETEEEIGVRVPEAQVLGELSELYIPPSNMRVFPVVALAPERPKYTPDLREVVQVLDFSLAAFADPNHQTHTTVRVAGNVTMEAPSFVIEERIIWGATAMMISELLAILEALD